MSQPITHNQKSIISAQGPSVERSYFQCIADKISAICSYTFEVFSRLFTYFIQNVFANKTIVLLPASIHKKTLIASNSFGSFSMNIPPIIPKETLIDNGYGEYVIRSINRKELSKETFLHAQTILKEFHVYEWATTHSNQTEQNRVNQLNSKIGTLGLELVFIPKTLFELCLLSEIMGEEFKKLNKFTQNHQRTEEEINEFIKESKKMDENSWITSRVSLEGVNDSSYRFNQLFVEMLDKKQYKNKVLSMGEINELLEEKIKYIQDECAKYKPWITCNDRSLIAHFAGNSSKGILKNMTITEEAATVLRHAVHIESHETIKGKVLLYRGGNLQKDAPISKDSNGACYSLSYGCSMFAGVVTDEGATAWTYMLRPENHAYMIPVDPRQNHDQPLFYVPLPISIGTILNDEKGEHFHGRSRVFKTLTPTVFGYQNGEVTNYDQAPYKSSLNQKVFVNHFCKKMDEGFILKMPEVKKKINK